MSLWILDTDHISLLQRNHPNVKQRLLLIDPNKIFVTVITFEEQMRGRLNQVTASKISRIVNQCLSCFERNN